MGENIILLCGDGSIADYASSLAMSAGDDLGLVLTAIEFGDEKVSGGRVEEERPFGKTLFQAFDEPIFLGSAIAQLAGHADAVVVDCLDDWAGRLLKRFPDDPVEVDAEIASLTSVMKAQMSDLILICRKPELFQGSPEVGALVRKVLEKTEAHAERIIDLSGAEPAAVKGELRD